MPKHTVIMSLSASITIEVDVDDKDHAYDAAKDVFYDVLAGGNIREDIHALELIDVEPEEELSDDEFNAREEMMDMGWRRATKEEIDQGLSRFQHEYGVQVDLETWQELSLQNPDTSIVE